MTANLIYHLNSGVIAGTVAGQHFYLPSQSGAGSDFGSWQKVGGLDWQWEVVEYGGGEHRIGTLLLRAARTLPTPQDASSCSYYLAGNRVAVVDDGIGGFLIHGWPPCNGRRCVVVVYRWEEFLKALVREGRGSIRFAN